MSGHARISRFLGQTCVENLDDFLGEEAEDVAPFLAPQASVADSGSVTTVYSDSNETF